MADPGGDLFQQAFDHHVAGRLTEAADLYHAVLAANPEQADALYLLAAIAHQRGQPAEAIERIRRALAVAPDQARCYNLLGLELMALGRFDEAEASFRQAVALEPSSDSYNNLGILLKQAGRLDDAIDAFREALARTPCDLSAHYNLGNAYREKGQMEAAAECFRHALEGDPDHLHALAALGQVLHTLERPKEAIPLLQRAVLLAPGDSGLYCDLGDAWQSLGSFEPAVAAYRRALEVDPKLARAWYSAGCAESARKEYAAAAACFRQALALHSTWPEAQHNLGQVLFHLGQVEEALQLFRQAAAAGPPALPLEAIAVMIPGDPSSDNQAILDARRAWAERHLPPCPTPSHAPLRAAHHPLRIGYVSAFFADHNWMKPVWALINHHDRERFQVHLFSDKPASGIEHGYRADPRDRFHDTTALSNEALAQRIAEEEIDLLIDLNGYSKPRRLPLFAMRPAPVIAGWFNMYATTGIAAYDYLIGDDRVIPLGEERFYCERIVRVPGSYLTFEVTYPVPEVTAPPCLEKGAVTFGSMAPQYKITNQAIEVWSRILLQVPGSSLILKNRALLSEGVRRFVLGLFDRHQVAPERVRYEGPADHYTFLEAYGDIDIALDTFPYNGGTTTTEAIWQGVPVAAFSGDRWVSRTSASILRAAGLQELVGETLEDYVAIAVRLAGSPGRLQDLRRSMRSRLLESPVCAARDFARNMERLYVRMIG